MTKTFSFQVKKDANGNTMVLGLEQLKSANGQSQGQIQGTLTEAMQPADVAACTTLLATLQTLLEAQ